MEPHVKAAVITCSNRSAAGARADESGQLIATWLADTGHEVVSQVVVPDEIEAIRSAVRDALAAGARGRLDHRWHGPDAD